MTRLSPYLNEWPPEALEDFRERAAIIEVDGRIPRARAEAIAEEAVRKAWRQDRRAGDAPARSRRAAAGRSWAGG